MQATVEIPDGVLRELQSMAEREGATTADLIRRLVEDHVAHHGTANKAGGERALPLIPASETGPIQPVTGSDLDQIFSRDDFAARR